MSWLLLFGIGLVLIFGFVITIGAPYLPTLQSQQTAALNLLALRPGQTLLELGCGDGRVLRRAAQQGLTAIGYEINPVLVIVAKLMTWQYRHQVRVVWANYWRVSWPQADGIFVFLLDKYMKKLDNKVAQYAKKRSIKLASFAFKIPGRKITAERAGVYLYTYR